MADHPFDPVALVLGLLSIVAGIVVVVGGELTDEARWLLPIGLNGLGLALLVRTVARRDPALAPVPSEVAATPTPVDAEATIPRDADVTIPMDADVTIPTEVEGASGAWTGSETARGDLPEPADRPTPEPADGDDRDPGG